MLRNMKGTVEVMVSRSLVKRAVAFGSDAQKVRKYRQELDLAIDLFGVSFCDTRGSMPLALTTMVGARGDNECRKYARDTSIATEVDFGPREYQLQTRRITLEPADDH